MLTIIIIAFLLGLIVGLTAYWGGWDGFVDFAQGFLIGAFIGGTIGLVVAASIGGGNTYAYTAKSELGALGDINQMGGSFFLGSGMLEGKQYFTYYKKVGDNQYQLRNIEATSSYPTVTVVQDATSTPYAETTENVLKPGFELWGLVSGNIETVTFHVPVGTIKNNFVLDAQ